MDPLSIAASSGALVTLCTTISRSLYKFIRDARAVDQALKAFRDEIDDLSGVLASIESSFRDDRIAEAALRGMTGHERPHWEKAGRAMNDCRGTLERLTFVLEQVRGEHGYVFFPRPRRQIRLDMNTTEIVGLRQQIQSYKDTMKLSFHMITISLILTGQNSNTNVLSILDRLTKEIRELQRNLQSRPARRPFSSGDSDSNDKVMENLEDYLNSARSLVITASVLSESQDNSDIVEWIKDLQFESPDDTRAITSPRPRSSDETDKVLHEPTSNIGAAPQIGSPESPTTETYVVPTRSASQYSQIQLPPEVVTFIDECEKVEKLHSEGDRLEASRLGIEFLKTLVRQDVPPETWDDVKKSILHADERGLASSGHGFTVLHLLARNDLGQYIKVLLRKGANINATDRDQYTPLHISCWSGHNVTSKLLIESGALINAKTKDQCTSLHFACQEGHDGTARILIRNGADLEAKDRDQRTPLCYACRKGHLATASLLIDEGALIEAKTTTHLSPLHYACENGHLATTRLLIKKGASIEALSKDNRTPLHLACLSGHYNVVELLLDRKAHIEARDREKRTPLCCASWNNHHAVAKLLLSNLTPNACKKIIEARMTHNSTSLHISCEKGHLATAKLLIERGADREAKDKDGRSPLFLACRYGHYTVAELLIEHKADLEAHDKDKRTPLCVTSEHNQTRIFTLLLEHGAYVEAKSADQGTPLYAACRNGHESTARILINKKAELNVKASKGYTPLHIACRYGHKGVVELLLDQGAYIEAKEKKQRTPLRIACEYGHEDTVRMLLARGANIEAKSEFNYTPLHSACWSGHVGTARLLVASGANRMAKTIDCETPKSIARKHNAGLPDVVAQLEEVVGVHVGR